MIDVSVVMATWNRAEVLRQVLASIYRQCPPFTVEVIVVDDGSTDHTPDVCRSFPVRYQRIERPSAAYRSPSVPRNVGFRLAHGAIVVNQSADVEHVNADTMAQLVARLEPTTCTIARVLNIDANRAVLGDHFGYRPERLIFFLGALWRSTLYELGGQDEDFTEPGYEDTWFRRCLRRHGYTATYCDDVIGFHHDHPHPVYSDQSRRLYEHKMRWARRGQHPWGSRSGPWTDPTGVGPAETAH